jgi:hypothetical protein
MNLVHLVMMLALLEFLGFGWAVGRARDRYNVPAPATSGNEQFERYFRVQMNTLEQLIIFLPSLLVFAHYFDPRVAAGLGALFIVGRYLYFSAYVRDPKKRGTGFLISSVPNMILMLGALVGAVRALLH